MLFVKFHRQYQAGSVKVRREQYRSRVKRQKNGALESLRIREAIHGHDDLLQAQIQLHLLDRQRKEQSVIWKRMRAIIRNLPNRIRSNLLKEWENYSLPRNAMGLVLLVHKHVENSGQAMNLALLERKAAENHVDAALVKNPNSPVHALIESHININSEHKHEFSINVMRSLSEPTGKFGEDRDLFFVEGFSECLKFEAKREWMDIQGPNFDDEFYSLIGFLDKEYGHISGSRYQRLVEIEIVFSRVFEWAKKNKVRIC